VECLLAIIAYTEGVTGSPWDSTEMSYRHKTVSHNRRLLRYPVEIKRHHYRAARSLVFFAFRVYPLQAYGKRDPISGP
jgi:hypothetical protein